MKSAVTIIRFRDACKLCGYSRAGMYRAIKAELMPPPIHISENCSGFTEHELTVMNAAIISGRSKDERRQLARELKVARARLLVEVLAE